MSYFDRFRDPRYTSPSGKTFSFDVREVSRGGEKKASIHEFPEQDSAAVQDLGMAASRFSLLAIFDGDDYDQTADKFFTALTEHGAGTLVHPRWGDLKVLALKWVQKEGLVEGMRKATFEIDFVRYGSAIWPTTTVSAQATAAAVLDGMSAAGAAAQVVPESALDQASCEGLAKPDDYTATLKAMVSGVAGAAADIQAQADAVTNAIDNLVTDPLALAEAIITLMSAPGRAIVSIQAKVTGYVAVVGMLGKDVETKAQAAVMGLYSLGALSGAVGATTAGPLANRSAATTTSGLLSTLAADTWDQIDALEATGWEAPLDMVQAIKEGLAQAQASLLETAFSLPAERRVVLSGDRSPLELAFDLYGDPDRLDDVIAENDLQGDEIFGVSAGVEVVYYG